MEPMSLFLVLSKHSSFSPMATLNKLMFWSPECSMAFWKNWIGFLESPTGGLFFGFWIPCDSWLVREDLIGAFWGLKREKPSILNWIWDRAKGIYHWTKDGSLSLIQKAIRYLQKDSKNEFFFSLSLLFRNRPFLLWLFTETFPNLNCSASFLPCFL